MPPIHLILFDLDNTLIDRNQAFAEYIGDLPFLKNAGLAPGSGAGIRAQLLMLDRGGQTPRERFCREACEIFPDLFNRPEDFFHDHERIVDYVRTATESARLLNRLNAAHNLAVLSNGSPDRQRKKLERSGLTEYFERVFVSGDPGVPPKPDPAAFAYVLDHFKVEGRESLMVGDDWVRDIEGAVQAGFKAVYLRNEFSRPRGPLAGKIPELDNLEQLEEIL